MGSEHTPEQDFYWDCICIVLASVADTVIIPMWDYLGCSEEARINVPSAAGRNRQWRMPRHSFTERLIWHCRMLAEIYDREPKPVPVLSELEATLAEAEAATKAEECTEPDAVSTATVSEETVGLY